MSRSLQSMTRYNAPGLDELSSRASEYQQGVKRMLASIPLASIVASDGGVKS